MLRLAVVDDPALAAAVVRVRGEWNSQTGAELEVAETTEKELAQADALSTDAVVCPIGDARRLGRAWADRPRAARHNQRQAVGGRLRVAQASRSSLGHAGHGRAVRLAACDLLLSCRPAGETRPPSAPHLGRSMRIWPSSWPRTPTSDQPSVGARRGAGGPELPSHFGRGAGGEGLVRHHRALGARLGRPGPAGPRGPAGQTPRQLFHVFQYRDDGAAGVRGGHGRGPEATRGGGQVRTGRSHATIRRLPARPSGTASAAWPSRGRPRPSSKSCAKEKAGKEEGGKENGKGVKQASPRKLTRRFAWVLSSCPDRPGSSTLPTTTGTIGAGGRPGTRRLLRASAGSAWLSRKSAHVEALRCNCSCGLPMTR